MKEPEGRLRYLSHDEANRLIDHLSQHERRLHLRDMVEFALATGLREANICGLQWGRVDLESRLAWIPADESKTGRALRVPLNGLAMSVLERRQGIHSLWCFTYQGRRVTRCNNSAFRKALAACNLDDVSFHSIRHTWASWQVMAGVPIQVVMELGGWTNMRTVLRYAHLAPDYLAEYAGKGVERWRNTGA
jgi:integrase